MRGVGTSERFFIPDKHDKIHIKQHIIREMVSSHSSN